MRRHASQFCLLAFALLVSGCIEFESQTMAYRYDATNDQLRIFQDYHGIFGGDAGDGLSEEEQTQLDSVLASQRTFFFANWIFEYNRPGMEAYRQTLDAPDQNEFEPADLPAIKKLVDLAIENIRVENGPFYLDGEKKLSGVQQVTIGKFSGLVAQLNTCMPIFLKQAAGEEDISPADLDAIKKFQADPEARLLSHEGNAFTLCWPTSRASFDEAFGPASESADRAAEVRRAGIGIDWQDGRAIHTVGKKDDPITRVTLGMGSEKTYKPNVQAALPPGHAVKDKFDPGAAAKGFLLGEE